MKSKILLIAAIVLPALLASAWGADLFGTWIAKRSGWLRGTAETVFSFEPVGTSLTGTVTEPQGRFDISDGRIAGDEIYFIVIRKPSGKEVKAVYKGKVSLNEIHFTLEIEGARMQPQKFIAEREFLRHNDYIPRPVYAPDQPQKRIR